MKAFKGPVPLPISVLMISAKGSESLKACEHFQHLYYDDPSFLFVQ
jgi:hypothetical protein